jgi:hypothetical protein
MEGRRRHMQQAHLGLAGDDITQIRQHTLNRRAKSFGTIVYLSCDRLCRN